MVHLHQFTGALLFISCNPQEPFSCNLLPLKQKMVRSLYSTTWLKPIICFCPQFASDLSHPTSALFYPVSGFLSSTFLMYFFPPTAVSK